MLPVSSSNHHTHIEPSWKTYYDAKKLLRQTEQRLKDAREYYPHVHLNNHHENTDLSNLSSSSFLLHGDTSSIHAGNRSMLNDDRIINNKHQILDSEALLTIRRKISKQKIAAERRAEQLFHSQSDAGHMFESYRPHSAYSTSASLQNLHYSPHRQQRFSPPKPQPSAYSSHLSQSQSFPSELGTVLQHSTSARILHRENDFERQATTRKTTKIIPKDNYSLSNGRSTQQRSVSAANSSTTKYQDHPSSHFLNSNDSQRLKHVRRVESAHASSGPGAKTSLITPDSWRTDPIVSKKSSSISQQEKLSNKKTTTEIISKRTKTDIEESLGYNNQRTEKIIKPKRDTSASKPSIIFTEKTPLKPPPKPKSDDDKKKLQDYIQQKREHEEMFSNENRLKDEQERIRRDKLKKLNEQIKETPHQYLPSSSTKRTSAFTPITPKELTEQTRQRLLRVLGPSTDYHINSPLEEQSLLEHSSSSSSSSSSSYDSVIEVQPAKPNDRLTTRARSEPPVQNGALSNNVQRHEDLLRWAVDLTRDCDMVENRFKYLQPDATQPFDIIPPPYQHLQRDDGNLRYQTSHYGTNHPETVKSFTTSHLPRGLNSNRLTDYHNEHLSSDPLLERRIYHDRAAAKIQAAYRGYSVRKSLPWLNEKQKHLQNKNNKRPNHYRETSSISINIRLTNNNFPHDSTLLRYYENPSITDHQQQSVRKITTLPTNSDDNVPNALSSNLSTPINHKQIPIRNPNLSLDLPSTTSSTSTTPIPSPEVRVPSQTQRRRSISPPLPPQMSPDNGRPLHHLEQTTSQRLTSENINHIQNLPINTLSHQQTRKSPVRQPSLSSSISPSSIATNRKHRSSSPQQPTINTHARHRTSQNSSPPTSSSESILTAREKRVRQKFNSDIELQAYEKRLKDIEKKIRQLVKRAFEIFDENRNISSPPTVARTTKADIRSKLSSNHFQDESSISEVSLLHRKDTEPIKKESDTSTSSIQQRQSDVVTSDASDLECRVRAYREQLKAKKLELDRLKQRKNKEILRRQEDELKRQIESYDHEIQTLRLQPIQQEQTVPVPSSSSSLTEKTQSRPLETSPDERDTQHDVQSKSVATDLPIDIGHDYDSRRSSINNDKPTLGLNTNLPISSKGKEDSVASLSSSLTTSEKSIKSPALSEPRKSAFSLVQERIKTTVPPEPIRSASSPIQNRINSSLPSESIKSTSLSVQELIKPSSPPVPSESIKSASSSVQERIKSPSPPLLSESIKSASSSVQQRIKSPSPPLPTESIKSASSSVQERIKSPSPPLPSESIKSTSPSVQELIKSPSPPVLSESIKSASSSVQQRIKSPSPPLPSESIKSASSSAQERTKSSSPPPSSGQIKSPSSPSEPIKSPSPPAQERIKSPLSIQDQVSIPIISQNQSQLTSKTNEYDEDFSEVSHTEIDTSTEVKVDDIDVESIQEDIEDKNSIHDVNLSSVSNSSADEQSEILVLVKKSSNNTPRQQDEEIPPSVSRPRKIQSDDTSHDVSDVDEDNQRVQQENKIDKLTETFIQTFITEAIDQGKEIVKQKTQLSLTKEASEWISDEDSTDEENNKQTPNNNEEDVDNVIETLSIQPEFLEQLNAIIKNENPEQEELQIDLSPLDDRNPDGSQVDGTPKPVIEEAIKSVVPHTREKVLHLCHEAITILYNQNTDFSDRSAINRTIPNSYFTYDQPDSASEDIQRSHHAYCRMIFDVCSELLHEMHSPNILITRYPEWQKNKLISKRFYRLNKPKSRDEAENFIQKKVLEIINLIPRQITYSKWRMPIGRRNEHEQFEIVLDEELRRTETQWIDYEDDCVRIKFDAAEYIFDQLMQETLIECFHVINKKLFLSSNSTRL